jgi:hypothetical protein
MDYLIIWYGCCPIYRFYRYFRRVVLIHSTMQAKRRAFQLKTVCGDLIQCPRPWLVVKIFEWVAFRDVGANRQVAGSCIMSENSGITVCI